MTDDGFIRDRRVTIDGVFRLDDEILGLVVVMRLLGWDWRLVECISGFDCVPGCEMAYKRVIRHQAVYVPHSIVERLTGRLDCGHVPDAWVRTLVDETVVCERHGNRYVLVRCND